MDSACLRHTEIPHTSKLFLDFQYHFDRVSSFYDWSPADPLSYKNAAQRIDFPAERRASLVAALRATDGPSASLDLLAQPGTVAVVTGQQVGLFSGPAFTVYKAITAIRLAARLTASGLPAVPVFWLATEDHDIAEVNHCHVYGANHQPVRLHVDSTGEDQQPVGNIPLGQVPLDLLRRTLEPFPFGNEVSQLVEQSYTPESTFGEACRALLRHLFESRGLLFLDPLDPALRSLAAPFLRDALVRAPDLKRKVLERNKALEAAGYHAQVHVEPETSFFFLLDGNRRITLRRRNGGYASKDRLYSTEELASRPDLLSPNALLRPVMQDYMLPSVTDIGGAAELAYLAQSQVIYHELLGRMPVVRPRNGFTLINSRAGRLMSRYKLELPCLFHGEACLREKISRKLVPDALTTEFAAIERSTSEALDRLRGDLTAFDPTLGAALAKSRSKILYQLSKMESKTARESLRRDHRAAEESRFLSDMLFPDKHLQERYYSILPFLAEHGLDLLDRLYDAVNLDCPDHQILPV